jgi:tricorn protease-like protein
VAFLFLHPAREKGSAMSRRTRVYLPALLIVAAGVLMACAAAVLAVSREAGAAFPGRNGRIAYSRIAWQDVIYTINPRGGGKAKVTAGYQPSYSPDGKKIAYTVYSGPDSEIYMIDVGGGGKTQLTHNDKDDNFPSFSPDGKKIAYTRSTYSANAFRGDIYTIDVSGGGKVRVTHGRAYEADPSWGSRQQ